LVFASILTLNWLTGLMLASCFVIPLANGFQNQVTRPKDLMLSPFRAAKPFSKVELYYASTHAFWVARLYSISVAASHPDGHSGIHSGTRDGSIVN